MIEQNKQLTCSKDAKFCRIERTQPLHLPAEREWTRIAPMGATINPRVIPPMKSTSDQCNQTNIPLKETVIVPRRPVVPRDYETNPKMKTMYHYHFNDSGDTILGYCDNRPIMERNRYFKSCHRAQDDFFQAIKNGGKNGIRRYRSDYSKWISEYMVETSFVGGKILKHRIHDHTACGKSANRCIHYIDF